MSLLADFPVEIHLDPFQRPAVTGEFELDGSVGITVLARLHSRDVLNACEDSTVGSALCVELGEDVRRRMASLLRSPPAALLKLAEQEAQRDVAPTD